jgi:hypothetical protein
MNGDVERLQYLKTLGVSMSSRIDQVRSNFWKVEIEGLVQIGPALRVHCVDVHATVQDHSHSFFGPSHIKTTCYREFDGVVVVDIVCV